MAVLAITGCFCLFFLLVKLAYFPRQTGPFTDDGLTTPQQRAENLAKLRAHNAEAAASYEWIDQSQGVVRIPIERAMELTVQHYAQHQPLP